VLFVSAAADRSAERLSQQRQQRPPDSGRAVSGSSPSCYPKHGHGHGQRDNHNLKVTFIVDLGKQHRPQNRLLLLLLIFLF